MADDWWANRFAAAAGGIVRFHGQWNRIHSVADEEYVDCDIAVLPMSAGSDEIAMTRSDWSHRSTLDDVDLFYDVLSKNKFHLLFNSLRSSRTLLYRRSNSVVFTRPMSVMILRKANHRLHPQVEKERRICVELHRISSIIPR